MELDRCGTAAATDWKVMVDAATVTGRLRRSDIASISYRALKNHRELLSEALALGLLEGRNALPAPVLQLLDIWMKVHCKRLL